MGLTCYKGGEEAQVGDLVCCQESWRIVNTDHYQHMGVIIYLDDEYIEIIWQDGSKEKYGWLRKTLISALKLIRRDCKDLQMWF